MRRGVVAVILATVVAVSCGGSDSRSEGASDALDAKAELSTSPSVPPPVDEVAPAGMSASPSAAEKCLEVYGPESLARRTFAFEGDVITATSPADNGPGQVKFSVRRWYHGGTGGEVVLRAWGVGSVSSEPMFPVSPGTRLLVTGEDDFAWGCGFTQPWTPEAAREWERVFPAK